MSSDFGEVDWDSTEVAGSGSSDFIKLEQGDTKVRVMGNATQFYIHWVENANGQKKKFVSPVSDPTLVRKLDDAGFKRKQRWLVKVFDYSTRSFKIVEIGAQVFSGIQTLYRDEDWGPVTRYDIKISRGKPGTQPLYRVTPSGSKTQLPEELKEQYRSFNDRVDMSKFIKPAQPSEIEEFLGWSSTKKASIKDDSFFSDDDSMHSFDD